MTAYVVCDQAGNILRSGICAPDALSAQARQGEIVFEGEGSDATHHVDLSGPQPRLVALPPVTPTGPKITWGTVRRWRDQVLRDSDWTQGAPDAPLTTQQRAAWRTYRQQLRDLPQSGGDPSAVAWPTPPGQ